MARRPLVISHRTQAGTMPENTLAGIDAALDTGVDGIELDVRATADGVVVLLHDEKLERVAGDPRAVTDLGFDELRKVELHASHGVGGQHVPALAEVFERVAGRAIVIVEVKQPEIHELVAAEVRRFEAAPWTWIWTFDPGVGEACRRVLPEVPVALNNTSGALERLGYPETPIEIAVDAGFAAVSWNHRGLDARRVDQARRRGLSVYCWTPDSPEDIERVIEADVDAVCSDFPDRVRAALVRLGPGSPTREV